MINKLLDPLRHLKQSVLHTYEENKLLRSADALLISFPKCGRTWLRNILGKSFQLTFHLPEQTNLIEIEHLHGLHAGIPRILSLHDDEPFWKTAAGLSLSKRKYRRNKVIFLVRHPADVVVSAFFEKTKRYVVHGSSKPSFEGSLKEYVYAAHGSTETIIRYFNIWAKERTVPRDFLLIRYEDMQQDTGREVQRVIRFLELGDVLPDQAVQAAVEFSSFENMRKLEKANAFNSFQLKPGDIRDDESYKTRRGKIGGYKDYLEPAEIDFLAKKVNGELDKGYGYSM